MKNYDIKILSIDDIQKIILKLNNFYDKDDVEKWGIKIIKRINLIFEKYKVVEFEINKNSYMGIVIECKSLTHGAIYVKAVPPMIKRFENEIRTLKYLPDDLICRFYEIDYKNKILVMEKIIPGTLVEFYSNKEILSNLFAKLYKEKIEIISNNKEYNDFYEVVLHDYKICKKNNYNSDLVDKFFDMFSKKYKEISKNEIKYLLHGDCYKNNILLSKNKAKLIDPLGFIAPFVFELLSICAYEMFYNEKDNKEILNDFIVFFQKYADEKTYKDALFCQLVKLYIPSIYEANDGGIRANKWLSIIKELYPEMLRGE